MKTGDQFWVEFDWLQSSPEGGDPVRWTCPQCMTVVGSDIQIVRADPEIMQLSFDSFPNELACLNCGLEMVAARIAPTKEGKPDYYDIAQKTVHAWPYTISRCPGPRPTKAQLLFEEDLPPGEREDVDPGDFSYQTVIESLWEGDPEKDWADIEAERERRQVQAQPRVVSKK